MEYIILLFIVLLILFILFKTYNTEEEEYNEIKHVKHNKVKKTFDKINTYYNNVQFHNDYRDIITTLTFISTQKQMFNLGNRAVYKVDVDENEVKEILIELIELINERNKTLPSTFNVNIGWNNVLSDKSSLVESGWDKHNENLGLPKSIYPDTIGKQKINLIKILKYEKFITQKEVKYVIESVLQKKNVPDQMVLHLSITKEKDKIDLYIEEYLIIGFLTNYYTGNTLPLHMVPDSETGKSSSITSDKSIYNILEQRLNNTEEMMNDFTDQLDEDTKQFDYDMPPERSL